MVRELLLGPKRFTDLRDGLPHLGPDVLSQRLRELEQASVLRRSTLPPPAASRVYELTESGKELEPVVLALGRWGSRRPFPATDMQLGADALMIALKTMFDPSRADGSDIVLAIKLDTNEFVATLADGRLEIVRGRSDQPDASIEAGPPTLAEVLWHGRALEDPAITIEGDQRTIERFLGLFRIGQPIAAASETASGRD